MLYLIKSRRLKCKAITKGLKINKENYTPNSKVALNLKLIKIYMPNTTTMLLSNTVFFFHTKFHTNTYQISTTATTVTALGHLSKEIEQPIRTRFDNFQLS